ncbi:hypothetical protein DENSPDRAFT_862057 [Dentipellis sp. KUC8613]|nr:hypothetical protein DENSPDRAFT_862057 [Dentipellis sp. KUC8613]
MVETTPDIQGVRIAGEYRLVRRLFPEGSIYSGYNIFTRMDFVFKILPTDASPNTLSNEYRVYQELAGTVGIPRVHWFGTERQCNILVLDALGPSIEDLFLQHGHRFSLKTVLLLADQMITLLETLHQHNYIHANLKPGHFLVGLGPSNSTVHLISFGLATHYRDAKTRLHLHSPASFTAANNIYFASSNAQHGSRQSRRDDMESLLYILIYLLSGVLPWQAFDGPRALESKVSIASSILCKDLPEAFSEYHAYVRELGYEDKPDYAYLRDLFHKVASREGSRYDGCFDWVAELPTSSATAIGTTRRARSLSKDRT